MYNHYYCDHGKRAHADDNPAHWSRRADKPEHSLCPICGLRIGPLHTSLEAQVPPDPEETNQDRAKWGLNTLEYFTHQHGEEDGGRLQNMSDLLCDLRHMCDREGMNYDQINARAGRMYTEETEQLSKDSNA